MDPANRALTVWRIEVKTTLFASIVTLVTGVSFDVFLKALNVLSNEANGDARRYRPDSAARMRLARVRCVAFN
jgi:hypothetical protein